MLFLELTRDFPLGSLVSYQEARNFSDDHFLGFLRSGTRYGVFLDDELIAIAGMGVSPLERLKHFAEIGPFFVTASAQGTGAATYLMDHLIDRAKELGADVIRLYVDAENTRAIAFYERYGFEKVGAVYDEVRIDGEARTDFAYRLYI